MDPSDDTTQPATAGLDTTWESAEPDSFELAAPQLDQAALDRDRHVLLGRMFGAAVEPLQIGRYALQGELGRGGMGVVYAAHDRTLDRKVAIKWLSSEADVRGREFWRRFEREAKAMAKLAHPNVVHVYEIGEFSGSTFIAMEFVEGVTLRKWLAAAPRSRDEILAVFQAAGRGLTAVHEAGLVHRDFKPDNVMVRPDGRVLVMDFGLVGGELHEPGADAHALEPSEDLTATGTIMGTPVYMAPEQWEGAKLDARADQFAFCAALWEALHGERPFEDANRAKLQHAVTTGALRQPKRAVPQWIQQVLERGLAVEPSRRFGSMQALLDELGSNPTTRMWRTGGLLAALVLLTWLVSALLGKAEALERVEKGRAQLAEIEASARAMLEDPTRRGRVEQLIDGIGLASQFGPHAADELGPEFATPPAVVHDVIRAALEAPGLWGIRVELEGHEEWIRDVEWSPDGRWLATGGEDLTLRTWDADTGTPRHGLELGDFVTDVAFSPDGRWVIAATEDSRVSTMDFESGELVREIGDCLAFTLLPDGRWVTAGTDGVVRVSSLDAGDVQLELSSPGDGEILAIVPSPDGRHVVTVGGTGIARVWDLAMAQSLHAMPHAEVMAMVSFSRDGKRLATASFDGRVRIWNPETGALLSEFGDQHRPLQSMEFSPTDDIMLLTYYGVAEIWDIPTRRLLRSIRGSVSESTFAGDGREVLTATYGGALLWTTDMGEVLARLDAGYMAYQPRARHSPDERSIVLVGDRGTAQVWAPIEGLAPIRLPVSAELTSAAFAHDGRTVAIATLRSAWILDASSGALVTPRHDLAYPILGVTAASDDRFWLTTSSSGLARFWGLDVRFWTDGESAGEIVEIWDLASQRLVHDLTGVAHQPIVVASRTNDTLLTASMSPNGVRFAPTASVTTNGVATMQKEVGHNALFALSTDGSMMLVSDDDGVSIWNTQTGVRIRQLTSQSSKTSALALSPDDRFAAEVTMTGRMRIWDLASEDVHVRNVDPDTIALAFSQDSQDVLTVTADAELQRHPVDVVLGACRLLSTTTQYGRVALNCARARVLARQHRVGPTFEVDEARLATITGWLVIAAIHILIPTLLSITGFAARLRHWAGASRHRRLVAIAACVAPSMAVSMLGTHYGRVVLATLPHFALEWLVLTGMATLACRALLWAVERSPSRWWLWVGLTLGPALSLALRWSPHALVAQLDEHGALLPPALAWVLYPLADLAGNETSVAFPAHIDAHLEAGHVWLALGGFVVALLVVLWLVDSIRRLAVARFGHRFGFERTNLVTLPLLLATINLVSLAGVPAAMMGFRALERAADGAALLASHDARGCILAATSESRGREDEHAPFVYWDAKQRPLAERVEVCDEARAQDNPPHFWDLALELAAAPHRGVSGGLAGGLARTLAPPHHRTDAQPRP